MVYLNIHTIITKNHHANNKDDSLQEGPKKFSKSHKYNKSENQPFRKKFGLKIGMLIIFSKLKQDENKI